MIIEVSSAPKNVIAVISGAYARLPAPKCSALVPATVS